jgi:hypothetical protein
MKLSALVLVASVATASAFSPQLSVSASASSSTARHATIEKQAEVKLVPPKSIAEMLSGKDSTMDMYGVNVQKTYG